jgi:hypothetical protein
MPELFLTPRCVPSQALKRISASASDVEVETSLEPDTAQASDTYVLLSWEIEDDDIRVSGSVATHSASSVL